MQHLKGIYLTKLSKIHLTGYGNTYDDIMYFLNLFIALANTKIPQE